MNFLPLYHKGRTGKVVEWKIWTEGETIHTEWGQIEGKKQRASKVAETKNEGKANATSPERQAEYEARSMHTHKLERKYFKSIKETDQQVFLPMLAHDFEKKKKKVEYPVHIQTKLDGVRCMAFWKDDKVFLMSRGGKEWKVPHIAEEAAKFLPRGMVFDGEIYIHGTTLQAVTRLVKKSREGSKALEYHIYDYFDPNNLGVAWKQRCLSLLKCFLTAGDLKDVDSWKFKGDKLKIVHTEVADTEEEVYEIQKKFIEDNYEGAIVRTLTGGYNLGHRSPDLLKVKTFKDAEFEITGVFTGRGKLSKSAIWKCKTKDGVEFDCLAQGKIEEKEEQYKNAQDYMGKLLKVKYEVLSEDGAPLKPIALAFRLSEDT